MLPLNSVREQARHGVGISVPVYEKNYLIRNVVHSCNFDKISVWLASWIICSLVEHHLVADLDIIVRVLFTAWPICCKTIAYNTVRFTTQCHKGEKSEKSSHVNKRALIELIWSWWNKSGGPPSGENYFICKQSLTQSLRHWWQI